MAIHLVEEANRCLLCRKPRCQEGCPVHTDIPGIIGLFKERKLMEAGERLFRNNPMSVVCAQVCDHQMQCAGHCIQGIKSTPVHFYEIEHFVSDYYMDRCNLTCAPATGKKAAVVGSGPAGMTAAILLALSGVDVTIFESNNQIGGVPEYGIPDFRLPKEIFQRYRKRMLKMGIHIRPNTAIGAVLKIKDLFRDGYETVFVGTGAWKPKGLDIPGETLPNVHYGFDYLANHTYYDLGRRVAIIGAGNTAVDVARTALRQGAEEVTLFSQDKNARANSIEIGYAELEGATIEYGKGIQRFTPEGPVFRDCVFDEKGHYAGCTGEEQFFLADSAIIAISQGVRHRILRTTAELECDDRGFLLVDEHNMTTTSGVFSAGDVVTGPKTVVHAVSGAKNAVNGMLAYMGLPEIKY